MDANFGVIRFKSLFKADIRLKFPVGVSPTLNKNPSAYSSQIGFYLIGSFKKCDVLHSTLILFFRQTFKHEYSNESSWFLIVLK